MIKRRITNKTVYKKETVNGDKLATTEYSRKLYLFGIKLLDHAFIDDEFTLIEDSKTPKAIGFTEHNKKS